MLPIEVECYTAAAEVRVFGFVALEPVTKTNARTLIDNNVMLGLFRFFLGYGNR